jgi:hypothetical protein
MGLLGAPAIRLFLVVTDFNCFLNHAENLGSSNPNMGTVVNVFSFMAHHKALVIHLSKSKGPMELSVCDCCINKKLKS